jgi:hypothetical protein
MGRASFFLWLTGGGSCRCLSQGLQNLTEGPATMGIQIGTPGVRVGCKLAVRSQQLQQGELIQLTCSACSEQGGATA